MAELFARYEVNRQSWWPIISKVLVGSLAFHLVFALAMKFVPVARSIFGVSRSAADIGIIDAEYERTRVNDQVIMLTLRNGRFQYPEGFFATSDPTQANGSPLVLPIITTSPPVSRPPLVASKPLPASPKPPSVTKLPTPIPLPPLASAKGSGLGNSSDKTGSGKLLSLPGSTPTPAPVASPTPAAPAAPASKDEANKQLDAIAAEKKIVRPTSDKINKRPFDDLWKRINAAQGERPINWTGDAEIVVEATRTEDNKLQPINIVKWTGDPTLVTLTSDLVAAVGDSQAMQFMKDATRFRFTFKFTGAKVIAQVEGETESPERAKELAQTYGAMLLAGRIIKKGEDEEVFLNAARVAANGKSIIVAGTLPRDDVKKMIDKQLIAAATKAQQPPPAPSQTQQTP